MRRPSPFAARENRADATMTPMIDVVFLLLIFFVWTASFHLQEFMLPGSLAAAAGEGDPIEIDPEMLDFERVVVRLDQVDGKVTWVVNQTSVPTLAQLRRLLTTVAQHQSNLPVVIDPSDQAPLGAVIEVFDLALVAGFETIQFAASDQ